MLEQDENHTYSEMSRYLSILNNPASSTAGSTLNRRRAEIIKFNIVNQLYSGSRRNTISHY